ncbi:MAG TPA: IucA/IucC family protein [Mycobacteriales bacterium]|nr:IucA/IucC family protein [Mycobacteriales bacterium]
MTACWCGVTAPAANRADGLAVTTLLNTYLREAGVPVVTGDLIALPRLGLTLFARARYRSATGRHAWTLPVRLAVHPGRQHADGCPAGAGPPMDAPGLAALIAVELAGNAAAVDVGRLVGAVAESSRYVAAFLERPVPAGPQTRYLAAEQSLATGHPLHPTPKSRAPMTPADVLRYAPERHAAFPLHWFAADRDLVAEDSGLDRPATALLADLLAADLAGRPDPADPAVPIEGAVPAGPAVPIDPAGPGARAYLPVHPWQAARLTARPEVKALLAAGRLVELGPAGAPWHPTSSVRTLYRPDAGFQLKFTLEARITNSVRRNLRKELARGLEVHRLLAAGLGADIAAHHPDFSIVRDPAWVTLETGTGAESGFELVLRENPYPADRDTDVSVVAALCADAADGGPPRVARLVRQLARAAGNGSEAVAREWFRRYLRVSADPLLWLYQAWGIALEAHQQNTLLELDDGWPAALRYRDNQGYYFAESRADRLRGLLPGLNEASDTICADAVAEERLGYYLIQNNLLGVIGALGLGGVADERVLLADLAEHLRGSARELPLVRRLLAAPTLRGKGNLRTRLADLDELVGPMATQSVYVTTPNPIAGNPPAGWPPAPNPARP